MSPDLPPEKPRVEVQLLAEVAAVQPGAPFLVGAVLEVTEGWHLYWEHPGDAGQETWAELALPEGWTASEARYPGPDRFTWQGVESLGWESGGAVLHELVATGPGSVSARVGWVACKEICVPGEATVELALELGEPTPTGALDAWAARLPKSTRSASRADPLTWSVPVEGEVELFPGPELDLVLVRSEVADGTLTLHLRRPPNGAWGVFAVTDPGEGERSFHRLVLETR